MLQAAILTESSLNMTILSMEGVGDSLGRGEKNKGTSTTAKHTASVL